MCRTAVNLGVAAVIVLCWGSEKVALAQPAQHSRKPDYYLVIWYSWSNPAETLRHAAYDNRAGQYESAVVTSWLSNLERRYPGYTAFVREVFLSVEEGMSEAEKLKGAIEHERRRIEDGTLRVGYRRNVQASTAPRDIGISATRALATLLKDPDVSVRAAAVEALGRIGPGFTPIPELVDLLRNLPKSPDDGRATVTTWDVAKVLAHIDAEAAPVLANLLQDTNVDVRQGAAHALGILNEDTADAAVRTLARALRDADPRVRERFAWALGLMGPKAAPAVDALGRTVGDPDFFVRWEAVNALGAIGPNSGAAVPALAKLITSPDVDVRMNTIQAIGKIAPNAREAIPSLAIAIKDPDPGVRDEAVEALGRLGLAALPTLTAALHDKEVSARIRAEAARVVTTFSASSDEGISPFYIDKVVLIPPPLEIVPSLIGLLGDSSVSVRRSAAFALELVGSPAERAAPILLEHLKDEDSGVRRRAARALAFVLRGEKAIQFLTEALKAREGEVREAAAQALASLGPRAAPAVPALCTAIGDTDPAVRRAVARALALIGPETAPAIPVLAEALKAREGEVREAAAQALASLGPRASPAVPALNAAMGDRDPAVRRAVVRALDLIGPGAAPAIPTLVLALKDEDQEVRIRAAATLDVLKPKSESVAALIRELGHQDSRVRAGAATVLEQMGPESAPAIRILVAMLEDRAPAARKAAAKALAPLGQGAAHAAPKLILLLKDDDPDVRGAAARALGCIGPKEPETVSSLIKALRVRRPPADPNSAKEVELRSEFARALGGLGVDAVPSVITLLQDPDADLRVAATEALRTIGPGAATAVPELINMLKRNEIIASWGAIEALMAIGPAAARHLTSFTALLQDGNPEVRMAGAEFLGSLGTVAADAVPQLIEALKDADQDVRSALSSALARVGWTRRTELVAALKHPDPRVRMGIARSLSRIGSNASFATRALIASLADPDDSVCDAAVDALTQIGDPASEALLPALKDSRPRVRCGAAKTLGRMAVGTHKPALALIEALKDENQAVRLEAAVALGSIVPAVLPPPPDVAGPGDCEASLSHAAAHARSLIEETLSLYQFGSGGLERVIGSMELVADIEVSLARHRRDDQGTVAAYEGFMSSVRTLLSDTKEPLRLEYPLQGPRIVINADPEEVAREREAKQARFTERFGIARAGYVAERLQSRLARLRGDAQGELKALQAQADHLEILTRLCQMKYEEGDISLGVVWSYQELEASTKLALARLHHDKPMEIAAIQQKIDVCDDRVRLERRRGDLPRNQRESTLDLAVASSEAATVRAEMARLGGDRDAEYVAQSDRLSHALVVRSASRAYYSEGRMSRDYLAECEEVVTEARMAQARLRSDRLGEMIALSDHVRSLGETFEQEQVAYLRGRSTTYTMLRSGCLLDLARTRAIHARLGHRTPLEITP